MKFVWRIALALIVAFVVISVARATSKSDCERAAHRWCETRNNPGGFEKCVADETIFCEARK